MLDGEPLTEFDGQGVWVRTDVFAVGQVLASYENDGQGVHFHFTDWLGTRRVQTDYAGNAEVQCQGGVFGDALSCLPLTGSASDATPIHFTGKERDGESGDDYFGARYYASSMGRFLSPDPSMEGAILEFPQTWNMYGYEYNRPLYGTDPDGRCPICIGAVIGRVVEGGYDLGQQFVHHGYTFSGTNWQEFGANILGGAGAGGLAVATGGASLVESAVVGDIAAGTTANIVGGAVTRATQQHTGAGVFSAQDVSQDALAGFVGGATGHIAADMVHLPEEPMHPFGHGPARASSYSARRARRPSALINQSVRTDVTSSMTTHGTTAVMESTFGNGLSNILDWLLMSPENGSSVTIDQGPGDIDCTATENYAACN